MRAILNEALDYSTAILMHTIVDNVPINFHDEATVDIVLVQTLEIDQDLLNNMITIEVKRAVPNALVSQQLLDDLFLLVLIEHIQSLLNDSAAVAMDRKLVKVVHDEAVEQQVTLFGVLATAVKNQLNHVVPILVHHQLLQVH